MEVLTLTLPAGRPGHTHPIFATPDLTWFCRLDELGRAAVDQYLEVKRAGERVSCDRTGFVVSFLRW